MVDQAKRGSAASQGAPAPAPGPSSASGAATSAAAPPGGGGDAGSWIPAREAARTLGVQEASLYAYVSRGLVRSVPGAGGRQRLYSLDDLERLRTRRDARSGHGPVAGAALHFGEAVLDSAISEITSAGPSYRGYLAAELAGRGVPFENVAELLWSGALVDGEVRWPRPRHALAAPPAARPARRPPAGRRAGAPASAVSAAAIAASAASAARSGASPGGDDAGSAAISDALLSTLLACAALDPERRDARADAMARCGRRLIPELALASNPTASAADRRRAAAADSVAGVLAAVWRVAPRHLAIIDAVLVLLADHELPASTFAARVAASTGADPYAVVTAALAALSGPRHGTAALAAGRFLAEVGRPAAAAAAVRALRERFQLPPGFGHRAYLNAPDPRGAPLFELAERLAPEHPLVKTSRAVVAAAASDGAHPNVDFGFVTLAAALELPLAATAAWFAVGRCAGWLAHATEQRATGSLLRPRARYVGAPLRTVEYVATAAGSASATRLPRPRP
jgi:citrate synthase